MRRVIIRNLDSDKEVKPRVFDALIDDEHDEIFFDVKHGKEKDVISLSSVLAQINQDRATANTYNM